MSITFISNSILGLCFLLIALFIIKENNCKKLNWSLFYNFIWILFALPIVNYICVGLGYWEFTSEKTLLLKIPYEILFIWSVIWLIPLYFFKGKYALIIALIILWLDMLTMPLLEKVGVLKLNTNWLIGEFLTVLLVFIPGYLWGKFYYDNIRLSIRALLQVLVMILFLTVAIPFIVKQYAGPNNEFGAFSIIWFQVFLIIAFPSLIAVIDLVIKGQGTPFPYDKTKKLVRTGVYAYIKNPIQWSFTWLFIPLAIYHESLLLLSGTLISILYTLGVSYPQEQEDMHQRFGDSWVLYKEKTPSWRFLWRPTSMPKGKIYFKKDCHECEDIKLWFEKQDIDNLEICYSFDYQGEELLQVTYVHHLGYEYNSVEAIAHALEHINLAYASLGWLMRFPIIKFLLQTIIDALGYSDQQDCNLKQ